MSLEKFYNLQKMTFFFLCRSITGKGTEQTLRIIKKEFPKLKILKKNVDQKFLTGKFLVNGIFLMHIY